ncbi:class I fructose-bisphosphate aldolase [Gelidibacter salicanalis]|uniref:Probable fructose-bisphosphate aldolase class 1 n=1 Tax=Gelidibacter salicanalis TaxID=291193 RepID=A0A934KM45_9FLAO|nr:class I fructose-bisphosphate aldolase [Gelidibacter salicanalis]MBJ7881722.1 fructose-bisphosphate aldolase class I [Gelidibacter salicanalis]
MHTSLLKNTIEQLFANGKGILAMDESTPTCDKRFLAHGIPQTFEMRRNYRQLIATTPGLNESIGGAILYDETIKQQTNNGIPIATELLNAGIIPGIKVDMGSKALAGFPNEMITEGLDGLRERLADYKNLGARFAKWRAVITIGDGIPTKTCIEANVQALARYAALCQESGLVPIVEPEVLMEGTHSMQRCYEVTEQTLKGLFEKLYQYRVDLQGIILKPNMVLAGKESGEKKSIDEVAEATVKCFLSAVPATVPAIAFLSGGQSPQQAAQHLNAINKSYKDHLPWNVGFSFARAIQQPCLEAWKGLDANVETAQKLLYHRAKLSALAHRGAYKFSMETNGL